MCRRFMQMYDFGLFMNYSFQSFFLISATFVTLKYE